MDNLNHMLQIKFMGTSYEIALRWMPQKNLDDKSTLVQVSDSTKLLPVLMLSFCQLDT